MNNQIQKHESPSAELVARTNLPALSKTTRQMAGVMTGDRIKDLDEDSLHLLVSGLQREALYIMGQGKKLTPNEGRILEHEVRGLLVDHFGIMTVGEVKMAFIWGARGRWDLDDLAYSVRTVNKWLKQYEEDRKKAVHEMNQKPRPKESESPEIYDEDKEKFINSLFEDWKENEHVLGGFTLAYDYGRDLRALEVTPAERWDAVYQARDLMISELNSQISTVGKIYRREAIKSLKGFKKGDPISNELKSYAMRILVVNWFKQCKENDRKPIETK